MVLLDDIVSLCVRKCLFEVGVSIFVEELIVEKVYFVGSFVLIV